MKKIFFASDFHLGIELPHISSAQRERDIVRWLDGLKDEAEALFLVGDVFDFWFEYRSVVPKGYIRLLGKLAELRDAGVEIHYFTGNHDMWMFGYLEQELGIPTHRAPIVREWAGKRFFIGHGDGLGPGDYGYKRLKKVFAHPLCQKLFGSLHPDLGIGLANYWSRRSRKHNKEANYFLGADQEWLMIYANELLAQAHYDYIIFGHRHLALDCTLANGRSRYINLGDWLHYYSYAVFDGQELALRFFEKEAPANYVQF